MSRKKRRPIDKDEYVDLTRNRLTPMAYDVGLRAYNHKGGCSWDELKRASARQLKALKCRAEKTLAEWQMQLDLARAHQQLLLRNVGLDTRDPSLHTDLKTCHRVIEKADLHVQVQGARLERIEEFLVAAEAEAVTTGVIDTRKSRGYGREEYA